MKAIFLLYSSLSSMPFADLLVSRIAEIKPSAINTPYTQHAKNYLEREITVPPLVFAPDLVVEAFYIMPKTVYVISR
jgi:hypothetical protein